MKLFALVLALSCVIAYATAGKRGQYWPTKPGISFPHRFRREVGFQDNTVANVENAQRNSINFQRTQPLSGPDRRPTWNLNFNRNILNNGRTTADVYGELSKVPGQRVQPHIGIQAERNIGKNGFLRGSGQLQPGPGGRLSPSVGLTGGFRFRREAEDVDDVEHIEEY